jgi:hypothetical protein
VHHCCACASAPPNRSVEITTPKRKMFRITTSGACNGSALETPSGRSGFRALPHADFMQFLWWVRIFPNRNVFSRKGAIFLPAV